jgi:chemotaxis protein methyltransferase CheR
MAGLSPDSPLFAPRRPPPAAAAAFLPPPSDWEFRRFQALILEETGIFLADSKLPLLTGRLSRIVRQLGIGRWIDYYHLVERDAHERARLFEAICTHETSFFREPVQLAYLAERVFPRWQDEAAARRRRREIRVWSAGCSTGEEPYTLAMMLLDRFPCREGWSVDILATDLSSRALGLAAAGVWPIARSSTIARPLLERFMLRGIRRHEGTMKAGPEIRGVVRFAQVNLSHPSYGVGQGFDLILCRNVLIYFKPEPRLAVVGRLAGHLAPYGLLLLGHAESLVGASSALTGVGPMVYGRHVA